MTDNEIWKDIEDWPFHQVSNHGRVRVLPGAYLWGERIEKIEIRALTRKIDSGYMVIVHKKQRLYVHHLVLNTFVGPCPPGLECRHLNDDKSDNRWPENLKWDTHKENCKDRIKNGTENTKLTQSEVDDIKNRCGPYGLITKLAKEFGVTPQCIWDIRNGKSWKETL